MWMILKKIAYGSRAVVPAITVAGFLASLPFWLGVWAFAVYLGIVLLIAAYCIGEDMMTGNF